MKNVSFWPKLTWCPNKSFEIIIILLTIPHIFQKILRKRWWDLLVLYDQNATSLVSFGLWTKLKPIKFNLKNYGWNRKFLWTHDSYNKLEIWPPYFVVHRGFVPIGHARASLFMRALETKPKSRRSRRAAQLNFSYRWSL